MRALIVMDGQIREQSVRGARGLLSFVIPSGVEETLNFCGAGNLQRRLDFARHDNQLGSSSKIFCTASRGRACPVMGRPIPM